MLASRAVTSSCACGILTALQCICYTTCHVMDSTVYWRVLRRKDKSPSTMDGTSESGCPWSHLRGCCHNLLTFQSLHFCLKLLVSRGKLLLFWCGPCAGCLQCLGRRWSHNIYVYVNSSQNSKFVYCCTLQGTWHTRLGWTWHYSNHNCIFQTYIKVFPHLLIIFCAAMVRGS